MRRGIKNALISSGQIPPVGVSFGALLDSRGECPTTCVSRCVARPGLLLGWIDGRLRLVICQLLLSVFWDRRATLGADAAGVGGEIVAARLPCICCQKTLLTPVFRENSRVLPSGVSGVPTALRTRSHSSSSTEIAPTYHRT